MSSQLGRNDPCRCGSGKKYKKCCLPQDEERSRQLSSVSAASLQGSVPLPAPTPTSAPKGSAPAATVVSTSSSTSSPPSTSRGSASAATADVTEEIGQSSSQLSAEKMEYVEKTMAEFAEKMKGADAKQWEAQLKAIRELMKLQKK